MTIKTVEKRVVVCNGEQHNGLACAKEVECEAPGIPDGWFSLSYFRPKDSGWSNIERGGHFCSEACLMIYVERYVTRR